MSGTSGRCPCARTSLLRSGSVARASSTVMDAREFVVTLDLLIPEEVPQAVAAQPCAPTEGNVAFMQAVAMGRGMPGPFI